MSAVLDSENVAPNISPKFSAIDIREGDWKSYVLHIAKWNSDKTLVDRYENAIVYKRACALAYLGKRAQLHGGVCSTRHPHIMTQQFITELETTNKILRYTRYPWLKSLMTLLAEIEQLQDQISNANVITLVPVAK